MIQEQNNQNVWICYIWVLDWNIQFFQLCNGKIYFGCMDFLFCVQLFWMLEVLSGICVRCVVCVRRWVEIGVVRMKKMKFVSVWMRIVGFCDLIFVVMSSSLELMVFVLEVVCMCVQMLGRCRSLSEVRIVNSVFVMISRLMGMVSQSVMVCVFWLCFLILFCFFW